MQDDQQPSPQQPQEQSSSAQTPQEGSQPALVPTAPVEVTAQPTTPQPQPTQKSHTKMIIFIVLGVATVLAFIVVLFFVFVFGVINNATSAPLNASDTFLKTVQSNNTTSAYSKTSTAFQSTETQAKFVDFVKQYNAEINPNYTVVISKNVSSSNGTQIATIIYNVQSIGTAKNQYLRVELEQENSAWKVRSIQYQATPFEGQ